MTVNKETITQKQVIVITAVTAGLIGLLLPLYVIALYGYPCADDFSYAEAAYHAWRNGEGFLGMLRAAWGSATTFYHNWQGRYFDNLTASLDFGAVVPKWYFVCAWIVLTLFAVGQIVFFTKFLKTRMEMPVDRAYVLAVLFILFQILYVPYPVEGFYWFVASTSYTGSYAMITIMLYLLGKTDQEKVEGRKYIATFFAALLGIMIAGSNYTTALLAGEILVILVVLRIIGKKRWRVHFGVTVLFFVGFGLNTLAPSNHMRMSSVELMGPVESILASFRQSAIFLKEWFHIPVLVLIMAVIWLAWPYLRRVKRYPLPGLFTLVTYCLYTSMLTPPFYAGGTWGPGRLINTVYFAYVFLLCSNALYWTGWILTTFRKEETDEGKACRSRFTEDRLLPVLLVVLAVVFVAGLKFYGLQSTSSTSATLALIKGEAAQYRLENESRWEMLEDESVVDAVLPDFSVKPYVLYHDDVTSDPSDWRNYTVAQFFGKNSVRLAPEE